LPSLFNINLSYIAFSHVSLEQSNTYSPLTGILHICIILFGLVIGGEMLNSAIETVVDIAMPEINPKAKFAKDVAAGAVLIFAISSAIIGLIIFIPKIIAIL